MTETPSHLLPLPTFLIIGAQKSATRWLRLNLGRHPEVFALPEECQYFSNDLYFQGNTVARYRMLFEDWAGEPYVGESSPGYMMWRHDPSVVAERIRSVVPDVRLIAILRNPVDRAQSALVHHQRRGRVPADATLLEIVTSTPPEEHRLGFIAGGWYAASLAPYVERFGDQLLIQLHDDIATRGVELYQEAAAHIGASPDFLPPELSEVRFSNQQGRTQEARPDPLTHEQRCALYEYFRDDVRALEDLLGRDLASWDPELSTTGVSAG
jgi:hypothetical protein